MAIFLIKKICTKILIDSNWKISGTGQVPVYIVDLNLNPAKKNTVKSI